MEERKLFIVEFGGNNSDMWNYCAQKPIYVVAKDYNEAANKATLYIEWKRENNPKKVIDDDGSLLNSDRKEEKYHVVAVKSAGDEVIW